jgi:NEDD4-binding protein 2
VKMLILMRGVPGSGKSTLAKRLVAEAFLHHECKSAAICSTDDYFVNDKGKYVFDPSRLSWNHSMNFARVRSLMSDGCELIIVDNTNIKRHHMALYIDEASMMGYELNEVTAECDDAQLAYERCTHGVPLKTIERMMLEFEP